ncbi:MAG: MarR family transcriptional regulator [Actinomycetaceae bacterium]|nr:MarR family transcriptional regulator [Actinomycetaceae bacterium]
MTEVRWLDDAEQHAWRSFLRGQALVLEGINSDVVENSALTLNEYEVLVRLSECEDRRTRMSNLAKDLVHSRSRLTHTVSRLEKAGYVERFPCPDDRRGIICGLTDAGFERLANAAPDHVESVRARMIDRLEREEFLELGRIFAKLVASEESPAT